jgi:hypothetical protein
MAAYDVGDSPRRPRKRVDSDEQGVSGRNADQVRTALRLWQPRASRTLIEEDAREIAENLLGFFRVLAEWDSKERSAISAADNKAASAPSPRTTREPR